MPQINQLAEVAYSQFFWLLVVLAILYVGIGLNIVPKIEAGIAARDDRIADDLAAAQEARKAADEVEAAYRARMDESRAEALKLANEAKAASARDAEERVRGANSETAASIAAAEARIRDAGKAAVADIDAVAADAARQIVQRLAGLEVTRERAAEAVKAVSHG
ncbi:MAG: F-type H+-transporting ATPase subunit b [Sphingomonadales bacterium]|jgi:F-type H+-transporting ATPase subunit b|nr:F-type H+-transporting ATPase subunit b [Sphingomonadales bacterium]MEA3034551.1 F-type H+-transporting ATPase subunit b [Sphingomonadales bacterium]